MGRWVRLSEEAAAGTTASTVTATATAAIAVCSFYVLVPRH